MLGNHDFVLPLTCGMPHFLEPHRHTAALQQKAEISTAYMYTKRSASGVKYLWAANIWSLIQIFTTPCILKKIASTIYIVSASNKTLNLCNNLNVKGKVSKKCK